MKKIILLSLISLFVLIAGCSNDATIKNPDSKEVIKKDETTSGDGNFPRFNTNPPKKNK